MGKYKRKPEPVKLNYVPLILVAICVVLFGFMLEISGIFDKSSHGHNWDLYGRWTGVDQEQAYFISFQSSDSHGPYTVINTYGELEATDSTHDTTKLGWFFMNPDGLLELWYNHRVVGEGQTVEDIQEVALYDLSWRNDKTIVLKNTESEQVITLEQISTYTEMEGDSDNADPSKID